MTLARSPHVGSHHLAPYQVSRVKRKVGGMGKSTTSEEPEYFRVS